MIEPLMLSHIVHNENFPILDTTWIPGTAKILSIGGARNGRGLIKIFELNEHRLKKICDIERKSTFKTCKFLSSKRYQSHFIIGDFEGTLQLLLVKAFIHSIYWLILIWITSFLPSLEASNVWMVLFTVKLGPITE